MVSLMQNIGFFKDFESEIVNAILHTGQKVELHRCKISNLKTQVMQAALVIFPSFRSSIHAEQKLVWISHGVEGGREKGRKIPLPLPPVAC